MHETYFTSQHSEGRGKVSAQKSEDDTTHTQTQNCTLDEPSVRHRRYIYMYMHMSVLFVLNILYTIRAFFVE